MTRSKKGIYAAVVSAVVGAVVLFGCLTYGFIYVKNDRAENMLKLEGCYQSSLYELSDGVSQLESNLCKMMVSVSDTKSALLAAENYRSAVSALNGLSGLPFDCETTRETARFLNQVGDWNDSLSKAVSGGKDISEYRKQIEELYTHVARLNAKISDMIALIDEERLLINNADKEKIEWNIGETDVQPSAEYPRLIYDGPYSDAEQKDSFSSLKELPQVSQEQAAKVLSNVFDGITDVTSCGRRYKPECYTFTAKLGKNDLYACVSVCGGKILSINTDRTVSVARFNQDGVTRISKEIASKFGYDNLTPVWYNEVDGVATVNLVDETQGAICYCDLVKVKVGLDGTFIGFEATGYCKSHKDRQLKPTMKLSAAAECVSDRLNISNIRLAVIPKDGDEVLCYEVAGKYKGLTYFVYVDAADGSEVEILRLTTNVGQGQMVT